jgi:hypothetical protein
MGDRQGAYRAIVGISERKKPLRKPSVGWKGMNLEVLRGDKNEINLAQVR